MDRKKVDLKDVFLTASLKKIVVAEIQPRGTRIVKINSPKGENMLTL